MPASAAPPARAPRRRLRALSVAVHRYLGLTAGAVLVVIGLTESALVFRAEIDLALNPGLLRTVPAATRAPLQGIVEATARAYPDERPWRIRMPRTPDGTYEIWMGAEPARFVYADPYRGTILGARRPTEFLTGFLFHLHSKLLAGHLGERVAGSCALALALLGATGLVAWWPGRGRLRPSLTVAWRASWKRVNFDLHRALGFYASGLLMLAGLTGASLVFHEGVQRAIYLAARTPAERPAPVATSPSARPAVALDSLLGVARRALPGAALSYVYLPTSAAAPLTVRSRLPAELHPNGKSFVYLDPRTAAVLRVDDGAAAHVGARAYSALYPLHIGVVGGTITRALGVLVGLTPAVFFVTGLRIWRGRGRRPVRAPGAAHAVSAPRRRSRSTVRTA